MSRPENNLGFLQPSVRERATALKDRLAERRINLQIVNNPLTPWWSWHKYGLAFRAVPLKNDRPNLGAPLKTWLTIGEIAERELQLLWGGRWCDLTSFEYHPGLDIVTVAEHYKKTGEVLLSKTLGNPIDAMIREAVHTVEDALTGFLSR